ncbi:DNA glycosylase AlkZ-like family protein [Streptomyces sp. NPDC048337]|uniref:DNA glycosylase AlkZ-like family protein n=1 Tax=Streptomyces sp. NPDC048337 TaxID=3365535 RepID=UPI00371A3F50
MAALAPGDTHRRPPRSAGLRRRQGAQGHVHQPRLHPASPTRSLHEPATRYLRAYGPATAQDFAARLAAPKGWAAELFASLAREGLVEEVAFASGRAWLAAGDTAFPDEPPHGLRRLPCFDAHQRRTGRRIALTVEPLARLSAARLRALEEQAERTGAVLGGTVQLTLGEVTVGPHA